MLLTLLLIVNIMEKESQIYKDSKDKRTKTCNKLIDSLSSQQLILFNDYIQASLNYSMIRISINSTYGIIKTKDINQSNFDKEISNHPINDDKDLSNKNQQQSIDDVPSTGEVI